MVSDSNHWLIAADWRQYFFIKDRNLPPEIIGVPPLARAIVPTGTARKATGDLRRLRPVGQTSAGLLLLFWLFQTVQWLSPEVETPMVSGDRN